MNFDQDYEEFIEHIKLNSGTAGPVEFTEREDVAIRLFVAYLNCRYSQATPFHLTNQSSRRDEAELMKHKPKYKHEFCSICFGWDE